jgi:mannose-1-phosphate guanylyltransferase
LNDAFDRGRRVARPIVTIGIKPTGAGTGYGYIHTGRNCRAARARRKRRRPFSRRNGLWRSRIFETALEYVNSGQYRWNAGMFVWSFITVTNGLEKHQPEMFAACQRWFKVANQPGKLAKVLAKEYPGIKKISIDYALMEKAQNVIVADGAFEWDDLGAWTALARHLKQDAEGNAAVADFIHVDGARNIIYDARTKEPDADCRGRFARFDSGADGRRGVAGAQKPGAKGQGAGPETGRGCEIEEAHLTADYAD